MGEEVFRSESYLNNNHLVRRGAVKQSGGAVCGEVKVAICLRILAGASYLDLMVIFKLSHQSIFRCFYEVIEWINVTLSYPLFEALVNKDVAFFEKISEDFALGASDGVQQGCIQVTVLWMSVLLLLLQALTS
jgi:hypothetical protein